MKAVVPGLRVGLTTIAGVALLLTFLLADGESVHGAGWAAVPLAAWWLIPFAIGAWGTRSCVGGLLIEALLSGAAMISLVAIYKSDSSTSAVGLFTLPVLLVMGALVCVAVERLTLQILSSTR
jgi:hypothetical protein